MAHTPGPWAVSKKHARRITANGKLICTAVLRNQNKPSTKNNAEGKDEAEAIANADQIVKCVNSHDEIVKALTHLIRWHDQLSAKDIAIAKEALAKAGVSA